MDIYVGNIPYDSSEEDLYSLFSHHGSVQSVELLIDYQTGRMRGFAFVAMRTQEAESAIAQLHNSDFGGRRLHVSRKVPMTPRPFPLNSRAAGETIVETASRVQRRLLQLYSSRPEALRFIDRRRFEEVIAEIFRCQGYDVELTRRTRDGGRDIVAIKHTQVQMKFLIECKRPDVGRPVGVRAVRELYGVKVSEGATKALLVTTARFTRDAKLFLDKHRWELEGKDYDDIVEWFSRVRNEPLSKR